ncbi:photoreceptor outer segment membrane glycoprotein 2-like [Centruroides sculpturatus]|uniref:photoreceptor outer segment membrane glycoprotein 2-like n=1 Tax=Centruroides sculpturatus TaxID=218467 RepID=UPI000C6E74A1|nr:photoreceptor outer segment membrane glycoprotein 2-like [Centruroides sculpturatus]
MPCCTIELSESSRRCLALTLVLSNTALFLHCLIHFGFGIYVLTAIQKIAHLVSKEYDTSNLGFIILIFNGVQMMVYLFSILVNFRCSKKNHVSKSRRCYLPLIFVLFVFIWLNMAYMIILDQHNGEIIYQVKKGMTQALDNYCTKLSNKIQIDRLQFHYKCCGVSDHQDWLLLFWYPPQLVSSERKRKDDEFVELYSKAESISEKNKIFMDPELNTRGVPFSCCDPTVHSPCYHKHVVKPRPNYKYDPTNHSFYKDGCARKLTVKLRNTIGSFTLSALFPFLFLWIMMCLVQFLRTSINSAVARGSIQGKGKAYLLPVNIFQTMATAAAGPQGALITKVLRK